MSKKNQEKTRLFAAVSKPRKRGWFWLILLVAIIATTTFGLIGSDFLTNFARKFKRQGQSNTFVATADNWIPNGFTAFAARPGGLVAQKIFAFADRYKALFKQHGQNLQALNAVIGPEFDQLIEEVSKADASLGNLSALRKAAGNESLHAITQQLNEYLLPTGWAVVFSTSPYGQSGVTLLTVHLGHVVATKSAAVNDYAGRPHITTVYDISVNARVAPGSMQAVTNPGFVLVFTQTVWGSAGRAITRCKENQTSNPMTVYDKRQFPNLVREDPTTVQQAIAELIFSDSVLHELQHVRDEALMKASRVPGVSQLGFRKIRIFLEIRAVLRELIECPIPHHVLGIVFTSWTDDEAQEYAEASDNLKRFLDLGPEPWTVPEEAIRKRATVVLTELDKMYPIVLAHANDPDPFYLIDQHAK